MRTIAILCASALLLIGADGAFPGKWTSSRSDGEGDIRLRLKPEPEVVFTLNGRDVKTTVSNVKSEGDTFEMDWDFELEGYKLRSTGKGSIKGDRVEGKYQTKTLADGNVIDEGKFEGSR